MKKLYIVGIASALLITGAAVGLAHHNSKQAHIDQGYKSTQTVTTPSDYHAPAQEAAPVTTETAPATQSNTESTTVSNTTPATQPTTPPSAPAPNPVHPDVATPGTFTPDQP